MYTQNKSEFSNKPLSHEVKFIKNLSLLERREFFDSFDRVLCDCDGVIWHTMHDIIPGSAQAIDFLQKSGKKVIYVTNNSVEKNYDKFMSYNIPVEKSDIVHPAQTICDYLQEMQFKGLIYCIGTTPFKNLLRKAGFQLLDDQKFSIEENMQALRDYIHVKDRVRAVIIDVDLNCAAPQLMRAHVFLKDPECLFIGGAADILVPFSGVDIIGPGAFINMVVVSSKRQAIILGKPGRQLSERLKAKYATPDTKRTLFIGDNLHSDIMFGKMCGFQTLLVLSGSTKADDLEDILKKDETPDYVIDSLGDLVQLLTE